MMPLIDVRGRIELALHLQRHRLAEQRVIVVGRLGQAFVERRQARLGVVQVQMADAHAELRFQARGIEIRRRLELLRRLLPAAQVLQAHRHVEPAGGVLRLQAQKLAIALHAAVELAQFALDVSHRRIHLGRFLSLRSGAVQFLERVLQFAFQVQRDGPGDGAGRLGAVGTFVQQNRPQRFHASSRLCLHVIHVLNSHSDFAVNLRTQRRHRRIRFLRCALRSTA